MSQHTQPHAPSTSYPPVTPPQQPQLQIPRPLLCLAPLRCVPVMTTSTRAATILNRHLGAVACAPSSRMRRRRLPLQSGLTVSGRTGRKHGTGGSSVVRSRTSVIETKLLLPIRRTLRCFSAGSSMPLLPLTDHLLLILHRRKLRLCLIVALTISIFIRLVRRAPRGTSLECLPRYFLVCRVSR